MHTHVSAVSMTHKRTQHKFETDVIWIVSDSKLNLGTKCFTDVHQGILS
jgi:hypothetical protein